MEEDDFLMGEVEVEVEAVATSRRAEILTCGE
jgi:hypothetical protein